MVERLWENAHAGPQEESSTCVCVCVCDTPGDLRSGLNRISLSEIMDLAHCAWCSAVQFHRKCKVGNNEGFAKAANPIVGVLY